MRSARYVLGVIIILALISIVALLLFTSGDRSNATSSEHEIVAAETDAHIDTPDPERNSDIEPEASLPPVVEQETATPTPVTPSPFPVTPTPTLPPAPEGSIVVEQETATPTPVTPSPFPVTPTPTLPPAPEGSIVVDHTSVALFDHIPPEYIEAASNIKMVFHDRSVGANIDSGLDCLELLWEETPNHCHRRMTEEDWHEGRYMRTNWSYERESGSFWYETTQSFVEDVVPRYIDDTLVFSHQLNYFTAADPGILSTEFGFFYDTRYYDIYDFENFIAQHPDKIFIFSTTSLARSIGSQTATDFNYQMRQYAFDNNKILFDVADIESHTPAGEQCYDNRDGIEYCQNENICENHPDDGLNILAICQDYTVNTDGGHLGSVGKIRVAKAFWVLMARIAGWDGTISE